MYIRLAFYTFVCFVSTIAMAQDSPQVIPLWDQGAPGFEDRRSEEELAQDYWVRNIHNPSLTVYLPPKEKATGAAVVICPGGGHRLLVITSEGSEPAKYLNDIGVAAFVLKYRLGRDENSPYSIEKHALEDGRRAMRLVRSRAQEWGIDPHRIGLMGFSAGGEVVSLVGYQPTGGDLDAADPIDRLSCRPDFLINIYPGPLGVPGTVPADSPPAFLLVSNDDKSHVEPIVDLLLKHRQAGVPVEAHIYAQGGHGFNMGNRSKLVSIQEWPMRMVDWMRDNHFLEPATDSEDKSEK